MARFLAALCAAGLCLSVVVGVVVQHNSSKLLVVAAIDVADSTEVGQ